MKIKQKSNKRSKKKMYRNNNKHRSRRVNIKSVKRTRKLKRKALVGGMMPPIHQIFSSRKSNVTKEEFDKKMSEFDTKMREFNTEKTRIKEQLVSQQEDISKCNTKINENYQTLLGLLQKTLVASNIQNMEDVQRYLSEFTVNSSTTPEQRRASGPGPPAPRPAASQVVDESVEVGGPRE